MNNIRINMTQNGKISTSIKLKHGMRLTNTASGKSYITVSNNGMTMRIPLKGENA